MADETITAGTPVATITEAELFAEFRKMKIPLFDEHGKCIANVPVSHLLEPTSDNVTLSFEELPEGMSPTDYLKEVEADLASVFDGISMALEGGTL